MGPIYERKNGKGSVGGRGVGAIGKAEPVFVNLLRNPGTEGRYGSPV